MSTNGTSNINVSVQGIAQNTGVRISSANSNADKSQPVSSNPVSGVVLGEGEGSVCFEAIIPLIPLAFEVLTNQIERTIVFDVLAASDGRVFINGRLIKNIPFKTRNAAIVPRLSNISRIIIGDIRHITVEIPFSLVIGVSGSVRGASVAVLNSSVDSVEILNRVRTRAGLLIRSITEKDNISVRVRVIGA